MSVAAVAHHNLMLPDSAYSLWLRGELAGNLHLPNDGTRVEIIGGEIVVSPGPNYAHNGIIQDIERSFFAVEIAEPSFPWRCIHTMDLNLGDIQDGYIPDLIVLNSDMARAARKAQAPHLLPEQADLVIEVTSRSNASDDRQPTARRSAATKWNGYAQVGISHYLLIDRDPKRAQAILYSVPDRNSGGYLHLCSWEFGQAVQLPGPFDVVISTDEWEPWA